MSDVAVLTDSTSSLSAARCARAGIGLVPLQVVIDGRSGPEVDGEAAQRADGPTGWNPADVAAAMLAGHRVSTSRPSPEAFASAYARAAAAGCAAIVTTHLSAAMSGTVEAATLAAADSPVPVTVVDTRTIAMAAGFAVLSGAAAAAAGRSAAEVAAVVRARAAAATTYFCVDNLQWLHRGGRIGATSALLGAALSVKPLLTVADGRIQPYERVRTSARALARLEELGLAALARAAGSHRRVDVAVHHLADPLGAERLASRLRGRVSTDVDVVVAEVSAVLGVHVGPGTLGIVVSPED